MSFDLTIAVLADWLPKFNPPFGDNGFDKPYRERIKLELTVDETEPLESVYQRAIEHWQPTVSADSMAHPERLIDVIYWCWFYLPADEHGLHGRYERPRDLILIDEFGLGAWDRQMGEISYGDIVRAGELGLLTGDPLRPYLPMLLPQGGGDLQLGWEALQLTWQILEELVVARGIIVLAGEARERLLARVRKRGVAQDHGADWASRGGDPRDVSRTIDRKAWDPDDLRIVMNVPTTQDAEDLLALFGHEPTPAGTYAISDSEEARILRLAEGDVFTTFTTGVKDEQLRRRLKRLLETGEPPPYEPPNVADVSA